MNFKAILSTLALTTAMLTFTHNTPVFASEQNAAPAIQGTPTINLELKNTSRPLRATCCQRSLRSGSRSWLHQ